jgi:TM2 domain-containing membrane protein YozV
VNPPSNRFCGRCGALLVNNALVHQRGSASALPVVGSLILPGLGQMMNGEALKGFTLMTAALLMVSQGVSFLNPIYVLVAFLAAVDAAVGQVRRDRASHPA